MVAIDEHKVHYATGEILEVRRIGTNIPFIMGSLIMLLIIGLVGCVNQITPENSKPTTRTTVASNVGYDRSVKPYMYQFDVVSQEAATSSSTPVVAVHHGGTNKIPYIWNQVWESAGWTPIKLMVSKLATAAEYKEINDMMEESSNLLQKRHVYKYLAMAANGGGWLAHSDTFPLHPFGSSLELPNEGKLTAYGGPYLMSGNATEWLRMGKVLASHARHYHLRDEWTEAMALDQMKNHYTFQEDQVFEIANVASDPNEVHWTWNPNDCQSTKDKRVVHFRLGEQEDFSTLADPGDMVVKWLSMWLQSCERSNYYVDMEEAQNRRMAAAAAAVEPPVIVQAGTFHAPDNYDETRKNYTETRDKEADAKVADSSETVEIEDKSAQAEEEPPIEEPPVIVHLGSFHAPENYDETRKEASGNVQDTKEEEEKRYLRLRAMAVGGSV